MVLRTSSTPNGGGGNTQESLTHEEVFELALVDVMWQVPHKQLVGVWVSHRPAYLLLTGLPIPTPYKNEHTHVHKNVKC